MFIVYIIHKKYLLELNTGFKRRRLKTGINIFPSTIENNIFPQYIGNVFMFFSRKSFGKKIILKELYKEFDIKLCKNYTKTEKLRFAPTII